MTCFIINHVNSSVLCMLLYRHLAKVQTCLMYVKSLEDMSKQKHIDQEL